MTSLLRVLTAMMMLSVTLGELMSVIVILGVKSTPNELNPLTVSGTQDRSLFNVVLTGLDRPGGVVCLRICDKDIKNCIKCGELTASTDKASYTVLFRGYTERTIEAAEGAMTQPMNDKFGADDVELIDVQELVFPDPVYATITVTTTLQQLVTDKEFIVGEVDKALDRTDSSCTKICEEEANVCHECAVDMSSEAKKLIMVVRGKARDDADLNGFALTLNGPLREKYPTGDLMTVFSFTNPQLPREEDSSSDEAAPPSPAPSPPVTPPTPSGPSGREQVLIIKLQITIELSSLTKNSEELAKKSTVALGGSGGAGCRKICAVQMDSSGNFIITDTCYQCNGQALTRDGKTLEAKRWEISMSGRASEGLEEYSRAIVGGVTNFVNSIGGTLNAISVESTGEFVVPNYNDSDDGLSGGAIAGIVIGCVVGVALILVAVYCLVCKKDTANFSEEQEIDVKDAPDSTV